MDAYVKPPSIPLYCVNKGKVEREFGEAVRKCRRGLLSGESNGMCYEAEHWYNTASGIVEDAGDEWLDKVKTRKAIV